MAGGEDLRQIQKSSCCRGFLHHPLRSVVAGHDFYTNCYGHISNSDHAYSLTGCTSPVYIGWTRAHRFCCKMKNKNRRVAWHCHCMHCHYFVVISVSYLLLLVFMVMKFVYLASIAFFLLHAPDIFDNIQMLLVNLICFSDKLQIFLVG